VSHLKRLLTALPLGVVFAVSLASLSLVPAKAAQDTGVIERLKTCLAASPHRLLAGILVDESQSLRASDPKGARVAGAEEVVRQLSELASAKLGGKTHPKVEVLVAGFHGTFHPVSNGWEPLTAASEPSLIEAVRGFAARDEGLDTDFWYGLEGMKSSFAVRSQELADRGEPFPCMVFFMFTDGEYSIDDLGGRNAYSDLEVSRPNVPDIIRAGKRAICEPGGIADELRSVGATPVVVSLSDGSFDTEFISDFALDSGSCEGDPGVSLRGIYKETANTDGLIALFDELVHRLSWTGPIVGVESCDEASAATVCIRGFDVDDSISRFHLFVQAGSPQVRIRLTSPDSKRETEVHAAGDTQVGTVRVESRRLSSTAFSIDAERPKDGRDWAGSWEVKFIDPEGYAAQSQIFLYGDLLPQFSDLPDFRLGSTVPIEVSIVRSTGEPVAPDAFVEDKDLTVTVTDPATGDVERVPMSFSGDDSFLGQYVVRESIEASKLNVEAALAVTTSSGISLAPTRIATTVDVLPPAGFPSVRFDNSVLPTLEVNGEEPERTQGTVVITGPEQGRGCVWFPSASFNTPHNTDDPVWVVKGSPLTEATCVSVAAGEEIELVVTFEPGDQAKGSGSLEGFLLASTKSAASGEIVEQHLEVSFPIDVKPAPAVPWVVAALVVGAIGLPLAFLVLTNFLSARFDSASPLRGSVVAIRMDSNGQVARVNADGSFGPLKVEPPEYESLMTETHKRKRFVWGDLRYTARAPRNPFGSPWGEVAGSYLVGSAGSLRKGPTSAARVPLTLPGSWVVAFEAPEPSEAGSFAATGSLFSLISAESVAFEQITRVTEAVQEVVPDHIEHFVSAWNTLNEIDESSTATEGKLIDDEPYEIPRSKTPDY
jgi:hypothetical protein